MTWSVRGGVCNKPEGGLALAEVIHFFLPCESSLESELKCAISGWTDLIVFWNVYH